MDNPAEKTQIPVYRLNRARLKFVSEEQSNSWEGKNFRERMRHDPFNQSLKKGMRLQDPFSSSTQRIAGAAGIAACLSLLLPFFRLPNLWSISGVALLAGMLDAPNLAGPLQALLGNLLGTSGGLVEIANVLRGASLVLFLLFLAVGSVGFTRWPPSRVINGIGASLVLLFLVEYIFRLVPGSMVGVGLRLLRISAWVVLLTSVAAIFERVDVTSWRKHFN